jgi:hypothetical protein
VGGSGAQPAWPREEDGVDGPVGPSGLVAHWVGARGKGEGVQRARSAREKWARFWKEKKKENHFRNDF